MKRAGLEDDDISVFLASLVFLVYFALQRKAHEKFND